MAIEQAGKIKKIEVQYLFKYDEHDLHKLNPISSQLTKLVSWFNEHNTKSFYLHFRNGDR